ncbi:2-nonaprenyl-3-methyl-6-methoxy-1,4-benzoquinol hydroxylase [Hibiscus syriacus]|uniref:2-nonaprenyl-3-methyl-6-methoxy-1,4-benzoquinol hydroxylase n=1 Tax=Hibiscus syriacus TaxID=106335 RepID=A0A6A2WYV0_HIBSY|nr:2-nonaprenyl-3-methyl-6-methoxy-1,4-benzoquinol hydroxylase [Hibiscus syriacus]
MSGGAARKAWIVAATIGAVEALKDQGICRWNYSIRSLYQHAKNNVAAYSQAMILSSSSSSSSAAAACTLMNKSEVNMKKVMELSCFGANTIRF